jgi:hypothetical protein
LIRRERLVWSGQAAGRLRQTGRDRNLAERVVALSFSIVVLMIADLDRTA